MQFYFAVVLSTVIQFSSGNFLEMRDAGKKAKGHILTVEQVERTLNQSIESILGHSGPDAGRAASIEASIWRTYQALPKNAVGRLPPRGVRHIVHTYFAKEHGWLIEGLGTQGPVASNSEVHSASILQERAPALVEAVLEERQRGRGLSFEDVVVMVAALERLIFAESVTLLATSYKMNYLQVSDEVNAAGIHEIMRSYLTLFRQGDKAAEQTAEIHQVYKQRLAALSPLYMDMVVFESDAVNNHAFSNRHKLNPFDDQTWYNFETASDIVKDLAHNYGKWQNGDCGLMKEALMELDKTGNGRVPLDLFYAQPNDAAFHFHETSEYLRGIGALDESTGVVPQVRVANYVTGPSNCVARSAYYSVCCLNECEALVNELEGFVQAPTASVDQLVRLVGSLSSPTIDGPRIIGKDLVAKLSMIASRHDGAVPLHGRLFTQWMHFAFRTSVRFHMRLRGRRCLPKLGKTDEPSFQMMRRSSTCEPASHRTPT